MAQFKKTFRLIEQKSQRTAIFETIVTFNFEVERRIGGLNLTQIHTKCLTEEFNDFDMTTKVDAKEDVAKYVEEHRTLAMARLNEPLLDRNELVLIGLGFTRVNEC